MLVALRLMPRPLRKTAATSLKMTPKVRALWEQCATTERRSLTNMFEMMVREYAKKLDLVLPEPTASIRPRSKADRATPKKT
jgi:hypothetical protein